jgi:hypothetical protein
MAVDRDLNAVERATHLCYRLVQGEAVSTRQIATDYQISRQWAYTTLARMSRVLPLVADGGVWRLVDFVESYDD